MTDMRCYFGCPEGFKKDIDLRLHLKLRHKNENEMELRKAYQAAEEEIALTSATASVFQCALCPKKFTNSHTFYDHVGKRAHNMTWLDYKAQYGRCEVESAPFECKICGRVVKYTRSSITNHMKMVHSITWPLYLERIRNMREGERPKELPSIDMFECKICSASVKYIFRDKHLKGVHKITQGEYIELFSDDAGKNDPSKGLRGGSNMNDNKEYYGNMTSQPMFPRPSSTNEHPQMASFDDGNTGQPYSYYDGNNNTMPKSMRYDAEEETKYADTMNSANIARKNFIQPPTFKRKFEEEEDMSQMNNFSNQNYQQSEPSYDDSRTSPGPGSGMRGPEYDLPLED